eukprot:3486554-Pleurochrysis_carterae.AAC.1
MHGHPRPHPPGTLGALIRAHSRACVREYAHAYYSSYGLCRRRAHARGSGRARALLRPTQPARSPRLHLRLNTQGERACRALRSDHRDENGRERGRG